MSIEAIVLAAGQGTRMKSELPKVLHKVCNQPMLEHLLVQLDRALSIQGGASINVVVGHKREMVQAFVQSLVEAKTIKTPVRFTYQAEQKGTGHAVALAMEGVKAETVAVFNGDMPLFTSDTFNEFYSQHRQTKSVASLVSCVVADPAAYGRVVRKSKQFIGVVEFKDASVAQRKINEVNGGAYIFQASFLKKALTKLSTKNKAGEYYLPDLFLAAKKEKKKILAYQVQPEYILGVNNLVELADVQKILYRRTANHWMVNGVRLEDPAHIYIDTNVQIGAGTAIGPGSLLVGKTRIGSGVIIGASCLLKDTVVFDGSEIKHGTVLESSEVGEQCKVGPMAHFRPGSVIKDKVKVGNFVELKESIIGENTSISHLSYVGDATVGSSVNIGCGFVTCNYDGTVREGRRKHRSIIGDNVFIGSDCQVVAPIEIVEGTFVASGSTVTESVNEPDSLVIARPRQVTKPGYAKKYRS